MLLLIRHFAFFLRITEVSRGFMASKNRFFSSYKFDEMFFTPMSHNIMPGSLHTDIQPWPSR